MACGSHCELRPAGHYFRRHPVSRCAQSGIFLVLSGLATGASWLCYYRALQIGDAARVAPIDKLSVVLVAVFSVSFLGERLSGPNWLGVALIAAVAIPVAYPGDVQRPIPRTRVAVSADRRPSPASSSRTPARIAALGLSPRTADGARRGRQHGGIRQQTNRSIFIDLSR
jgi:hypothetical protein